MAEKDDKAKKAVKKEIAKKEPEVNPKKKAVKKKEEVKAPETKKKETKKEPEVKIKETVKKEEEKVQKDTNTTIEANNGAVNTAPKSVKKKKKKNGLVIFLTIIVFLLIAAIGFFAVLYYTDSDLLRSNSTSATKEEKSSNTKKKDNLVPIDSEKFEKVFTDVKWTVSDLTKYINHSEDTAIEELTAVEAGNTSSASYSLFENEKDAKQFYEDTIERLKDIFDNTFEELKKDETSGKNWNKYIIQTADKNEVGYAVVIRVDATVLVISTETDVNNLNKIMKNLGY